MEMEDAFGKAVLATAGMTVLPTAACAVLAARARADRVSRDEDMLALRASTCRHKMPTTIKSGESLL